MTQRLIQIDLNSDVGEIPALIADGTQDAIMDLISSVNIACGGHAGDAQTMRATLRAAKHRGLAIGAHPSFPDRPGFGRLPLSISEAELLKSLIEQLTALKKIADQEEVTIGHVKPHGALYNQAAHSTALAAVIAEATQQVFPKARFVGPAHSTMIREFARLGFETLSEAFIDRAYEKDGSLRSRSLPESLLTEPRKVLAQALSLTLEERVQTVTGEWLALRADTLCVHSDTPAALALARAVREGLSQAGVQIK